MWVGVAEGKKKDMVAFFRRGRFGCLSGFSCVESRRRFSLLFPRVYDVFWHVYDQRMKNVPHCWVEQVNEYSTQGCGAQLCGATIILSVNEVLYLLCGSGCYHRVKAQSHNICAFVWVADLSRATPVWVLR